MFTSSCVLFEKKFVAIVIKIAMNFIVFTITNKEKGSKYITSDLR